MRKESFNFFSILLLIFLLASLSLARLNPLAVTSNSTAPGAETLRYGIKLASAGLVMFDSLNATLGEQQLESGAGKWTYGGHVGTAYLEHTQDWQYSSNGKIQIAAVDSYETQQGLSIGAKSISDKIYTGFYAASSPSNATLFHAIITSPVGSVSNGTFQTGLYIQTASDNINYVTCVAVTGPNGTHWEIVHATGNSTAATNFEYLWRDISGNQPLTRECTIITNGSNYLRVFLDRSQVFDNSQLNLQIPRPLIAFLEVETLYSGKILYGTFSAFYETLSGNISVEELPNGSENISLVDQSGTVLAGTNDDSTKGMIDVGSYQYPLTALIKISDVNGTVVASSAPQAIFGGDVYILYHNSILQNPTMNYFTNSLLVFIGIPVSLIVVALSIHRYSKKHNLSSHKK